MEPDDRELLKKLEKGQSRLEKGFVTLTNDNTVLKADVAVLKTDVSVLKTDVAILKTDVAVLKTDVADLKDGQKRIETIVLNIENFLVTKIKTLFDARASDEDNFDSLQEQQIAQDQKLNDHELRIIRLEKSKQI